MFAHSRILLGQEKKGDAGPGIWLDPEHPMLISDTLSHEGKHCMTHRVSD